MLNFIYLIAPDFNDTDTDIETIDHVECNGGVIGIHRITLWSTVLILLCTAIQ